MGYRCGCAEKRCFKTWREFLDNSLYLPDKLITFSMKKYLLPIIAALACTAGHAQSYEPKWVGEVVVLQCDADTVSMPTEKANVQVKTSASAGRLLVGIGNVRSKVTVKGGRSTTQVDPKRPITLIVKCKDNESDPTSFIQIVKFEEKKKERKAELSSVNWIGNVSEGNMEYVPYEADTYGKSSYILKVAPVEGEFGVRVLNPNEKDEKVVLFYCFGAHEE